MRGAEAAAARAMEGLSFRGLQAPGPQTNAGRAPLRAAQALHAGIDLSCTPVAPEVFLAFRDSLHPSQPTHSFPAWSSLSLLDPWMEVRATGGEEEDESPWQ